MTDPLHVAAGERETVRVFALDLPPAQAEALAEHKDRNGGADPLAQLLGVDRVDRAHVELFPASDLKGVGLAGYISDGLGVDPADLRADAADLDATTGHVLVVHARAFAGHETRLRPAPQLRHLGTYRLAQAEPPAITPPAAPGDAPAAPPPDRRAAPPRRLPRAVALLALLGAALVVLMLAYLIGGRGP